MDTDQIAQSTTDSRWPRFMAPWHRLGRRLDPYLILLLLLTIFALAPLFASGYFYSAHDGRHSVFFVTMFDEAIRDGALWPRWAMHHSQGYGYPTFVIQAPLAFYVAEIFILLGAGVTLAVKLTWAAAALASAWGIYALVREWVSAGAPANGDGEAPGQPVSYAALAGLIAGLLYVYIPYRLLDMYVRAALAETFLMVWFPWVFLAFERLMRRGLAPGWQGRLLAAALTLGALLLTHVISLLLFPPLLLCFLAFRLWTLHRAPALGARLGLPVAAGVCALLLSAIFVVPLLAEGPLLDQETFTTETYSYERHWVYWGQFFSPFWGFGYSDDPAGANDGMGFQLGLPALLLALSALVLFLDRRSGNQRRLVGFLLAATAAILVMMTPAAAPVWQALPMASVLQFPWRLLALSSFTLSALGGLVIWQMLAMMDQPAEALGGGLAVALVVVLASLGYAQPASLQPVEAWREDGRAVFQFEQEHPDMYGYTQQSQERFATSPMTEQYAAAMPPNADAGFSPDQLERLGILDGEGRVLSHYSRGHSFGGEVELATPATIQVRLYDHPGWQVRVDGDLVPYRVSPPYGLIELDVPAGRHAIAVRMGATPTRTASAAVSAATLLALLGLWIGARFRRRRWG